MHPCHTEGHQVMPHTLPNWATQEETQQPPRWLINSTVFGAPALCPQLLPWAFTVPVWKYRKHVPGSKWQCSGWVWVSQAAGHHFWPGKKREISSADGTGSAPLSSLGGFVFASAAHLCPSFLCLLLPWMKGSEEEPWNVTLRDCFDAGTGRAESLACDKRGITSTLLTCIGPAFSPPEPPQPRQHHWECAGNNRLGPHKEKQGWPCCAWSKSLSSEDATRTNPRCWTWWQVGTLQLDSTEMQLSHQFKLASFYLSTKHQANASPMILLLRVAFWLPWWVHPLLCFFRVFPALFSHFPFPMSCTMLCWLSAFSELQRNKRVNFSHEN